MKTKYKTGNYSIEIKKVEVERETEKSVWVNGNRSEKITNYNRYYDTWDEAYLYLLNQTENAVLNAENRVKWAKEKLSEIQKLERDKT